MHWVGAAVWGTGAWLARPVPGDISGGRPRGHATSHAGCRGASQDRSAAAARMLTGVPHEVSVGEGEIWPMISEIVRKGKTDVIVIGTHGRTGVTRALLGSVAEEIFRRAACPVLTVGPHVSKDTERRLEMKEILYATDFSPESLAALPFAVSLAQEHQARLTLLHVVRPPKVGELVHAEQYAESTLRRLRTLVPAEAESWCEPNFKVEHGPEGGQNHGGRQCAGRRPDRSRCSRSRRRNGRGNAFAAIDRASSRHPGSVPGPHGPRLRHGRGRCVTCAERSGRTRGCARRRIEERSPSATPGFNFWSADTQFLSDVAIAGVAIFGIAAYFLLRFIFHAPKLHARHSSFRRLAARRRPAGFDPDSKKSGPRIRLRFAGGNIHCCLRGDGAVPGWRDCGSHAFRRHGTGGICDAPRFLRAGSAGQADAPDGASQGGNGNHRYRSRTDRHRRYPRRVSA